MMYMKKQKNDGKIPKHKNIQIRSAIDIDILIKSILYQQTYIRVRDLIKKAGGRGHCSDSTAARRLHNLKRDREIIIIEHKDLGKYGIKDSDGRSTYAASTEILDLRDHIESVFSLFDNKNTDDVKTGIRELRRIQTSPFSRYFLNQDQVDKLVGLLDWTLDEESFKDDTLRYDILTSIVHELTIHRLKPSNKNGSFVETLEQLLKYYPTSNYDGRPDSPLPQIMHLLGVYMDDIVINRLTNDAETCDPQTFRRIEIIYSDWYTAKLIEDSKTELMNFENGLQKKGKIEAIEFIERLRNGATLNLINQRGGALYDLYEKVGKQYSTAKPIFHIAKRHK